MKYAIFGLILLITIPSLAAQANDVHWPSFRGHGALGLSEGYPVPAEWDVASGKNILWKTRVPGLSHSSPVIWGNTVFLTTTVTDGRDDDELKVGLYGAIEPVEENDAVSFKVLAFDKKSGKMLWERVAHHGVPKIKRHPKATHSNSTPVTDGRHLVAFFGSEGLYTYDFKGNLLWKKDFGVLDSGFFRVPTAQWGFASSPIIHDGKIILQVDVQENSFVAALDLETGRELWRTARQDVPTWSTPAVHVEAGRTQVILNGYRHIGGYDLENGKELWRLEGGGDIPVPTPIVDRGLIFITNAHGRMAPIYAIRTDVAGEIRASAEGESSPAIVWSDLGRSGAYMQTPLVVDGYLYVCRDNGVLTAYRATTGQQIYRERLGGGGGFSASGVSADGKLFYTSEEGDVYVVKAGSEFQLLATNALEETTMATPAVSEGVLFFRSRGHLIAVGH